VSLIVKGLIAALASVVLTAALLALLGGCSPSTTARLCDTSGVVLTVAQPTSSAGKLAASVGKFIRGLFCPKTSGATDRLCPRQRAAAPVAY